MRKWSIGTEIWFGFYILCNWLMFIEYATKPITAYYEAFQRAAIMYGIAGSIPALTAMTSTDRFITLHDLFHFIRCISSGDEPRSIHGSDSNL